MIDWIDAVQSAGIAALTVGAIALGVGSWLMNRQDAKWAAAVHADRYERFLGFLSAVREANRSERPQPR